MKFWRMLVVAAVAPVCVWAQARLTGQADVHHLAGAKGDNAGVVVWLTSDSGTAAEPVAAAGETFQMAQRHQRFDPDLLVIPAGATVEFPNFDPYFHNVFSLGDNRPFDLGLYQAGSTRSRRFTQPGVSYVFCNIHPRMSGVILTVPTAWYAVSDASGKLQLPAAPPGSYQLHVWYERARAADPTPSTAPSPSPPATTPCRRLTSPKSPPPPPISTSTARPTTPPRPTAAAEHLRPRLSEFRSLLAPTLARVQTARPARSEPGSCTVLK